MCSCVAAGRGRVATINRLDVEPRARALAATAICAHCLVALLRKKNELTL